MLIASRRRGAAIVLLAILAFLTSPSAARADALLDAGSAPVVAANLTSGSLTIRTWDRPEVQISTDGQVSWHRSTPQQMAQRIPAQIRLISQTLQTAGGPVTLPVETFVMPSLPAGLHSGVRITGYGNTTVMIPNSSAMVFARIKQGDITLDGYRNGTFVAAVRSGDVRLNDVSGTGAVQVLDGTIAADNSDFTRLRARTAAGNLNFSNCNATQIEATSVSGSIVYDNGRFEPGLARFQSERGNVSIGLAVGGVQVGAHSASGHVYSDLAPTYQNGAPIVTASSRSGSVYLYNGSIRDHPQFAPRGPSDEAPADRRPPAFQRFPQYPPTQNQRPYQPQYQRQQYQRQYAQPLQQRPASDRPNSFQWFNRPPPQRQQQPPAFRRFNNSQRAQRPRAERASPRPPRLR